MARTKVALPLLVALIFAVGGAVIAYKWAQSQRPAAVAQRASVSGDIINVAVAAAAIPWGTKLSTETIQMKAFLRESLPVGYFTDPAVLSARVSITQLEVGDIILESRLAPVGVTSGGIAAVVTPGSRAIAVKGDKVVGLSGLIKPRDRVDVLVTIKSPGNGGKAEQVTKVVLENILVLAAGPQMQKAEKGESPGDVYTLEVMPEEAERLALAANEGVLHFALRNTLDSVIVLTRGATVAETLNSYRTLVASPAVQEPDFQAGYYSVEIIRGTSRTNVDF